MITRLTDVTELKALFLEKLLNATDKVSKVSDDSVLSGIAYGVAKVGQKALKDIALVESHLFPDSAYGAYLDTIAANYGVAGRFGSSESSTYIRIVATPGTTYTAGIHTFTGDHGLVFDLEQDVVVPSFGYTYAKVRSQGVGFEQNVDALSINVVNPLPSGHSYVINEYKAFGGRDEESDDLLRRRIKDGANQLARGTLSMLEQVFIRINSNVLRVFYQVINESGKTVIAIVTQNGIDLSEQELNELLIQSEEYLSLTNLRPFGTQSYGISLVNIDWQPIDISFRVEIFPNYNIDNVRTDIQIKLSKYLDYRWWTPDKKIEWDELFEIAKNTKGVKYIPDQHFTPNYDMMVDKNKLPRVRGFLMLNLDGSPIVNYQGTLNPIFYPNVADFKFSQTVLNSI